MDPPPSELRGCSSGVSLSFSLSLSLSLHGFISLFFLGVCVCVCETKDAEKKTNMEGSSVAAVTHWIASGDNDPFRILSVPKKKTKKNHFGMLWTRSMNPSVS